jgi:predicted nucleic acid-binding Zn ribbon protein
MASTSLIRAYRECRLKIIPKIDMIPRKSFYKIRSCKHVAFLKVLFSRRCANCGRRIEGKPYRWRGKYFCSEKCKKEYRRRHRRERKLRLPPEDAFHAIYWR